ncbi:LacI family DNA-binding transcriptional regulator [Reichenbachiella ulvae]|uniref:LacI family transcriptional regulator n=1 Tax=Reichenbachiella ulvae TaxID=2980104 RepID=A0ABT3CZD8_9BACT|nr:LacI family DNA-binding transcriptional regulator [Reichenbachiella ulvae]MCV9389065.1 LacI family transcriptional regulator [Reichenbachiella ulvae]
MKKKATIHDIAKELNINASTVSRALADSPRVKAKTKDLIRAKALEMGYSRNHLASNLRRRKTSTIGVIVPNISRFFFSTAIAGMEAIASQQGYNLIICQSHDSTEREAQLIETLLAHQVDGLMISIAMDGDDRSHLQRIEDYEKPVVFFDRACHTIKGHNVLIDDYARAFEATEQLIQKGCKRIVHFAGQGDVSIYSERIKGYLAAMAKHGLEVKEEWIMKSRLKKLDGEEMAWKLMSMNPRPDGIFSANDIAAISAIDALREATLSIPEDIKVFGFSGEPISMFTSPNLSTVDQNPELMGNKAAEILLKQINGEEIPDSPTVIESKLVLRQSSN